MAEAAHARLELCRDILNIRAMLAKVPTEKARSARILASKRIDSIRRILLGRPGRTLADDLLAPSGAATALSERIKGLDALSLSEQQEAAGYVAGLLSLVRQIALSEVDAGLRPRAEDVSGELWRVIERARRSGFDALVDGAIQHGSLGDGQREELTAALAASAKLESGAAIAGVQDVDPALAEKIRGLIADVTKGKAHLESLQNSANVAVRLAMKSQDPSEKEAYTKEVEQTRAQYIAEAKRINALITTLNEDEARARKLLNEARDRLQAPLREVGERMIGEMMASSTVTEQQAVDWAKAQDITPQARARLKKLGYPMDRVIQDMADFYRITGGRINTVRIHSAGDKRANASGIEDHGRVGVINLGSSFDKRVLWHELAHHLEADPVMKAAAGQHIRRRSEDGRAYTLRSLSGNKGYRSNEVAYKDSYFDEYVGKIYRDGVTEVFSMGVESMSDPLLLARRAASDPQTFELVMGMLKRPMSPLAVAHKELSAQILAMNMQGEAERKDELRAPQDRLMELGDPFVEAVDDGWQEAAGASWYIKSMKWTQIGRFQGVDDCRVFSGKVRNWETRRKVSGLIIVTGSGGRFRPIEIPSTDRRLLQVATGYYRKTGVWPSGAALFNEGSLRQALES